MHRWRLRGGNARGAVDLSARGSGFERLRGNWFERPRQLDYAPDSGSVVTEGYAKNSPVAADYEPSEAE